MAPRPDLSMPLEEVRALLARPLTGVLSTLGPGGFPHAVGIYYLPGAEDLRMWIYRKSQKAKNVERDPRCALVVEEGEPYVDLRGVLVRGRARIVDELDEVIDAGRQVYERYFEPRTQIPYENGPAERIAAQSAKRVVLALPLERIASWDHGGSPATRGSP
ncbi:MAG: pyridoxamine 5'-phosphate oxidase family protein [Actinomycetota bacterium]|nr:pyridoxamine 5'-phosphate oxidase family protein [Actinomycetota bacterium]